jgi:hypothetical protein
MRWDTKLCFTNMNLMFRVVVIFLVFLSSYFSSEKQIEWVYNSHVYTDGSILYITVFTIF